MTMTMTKVDRDPFNPARDRELIKAGTHFYCYGHLGARPIEEQSEDPRYCRSCCEFLTEEARQSHSRADWVPRIKEKPAIDKAQDATHADRTPQVKGDIIPSRRPIPPTEHQEIMSTPKPPALAAAKKRRGPKQKLLPVATIERLHKKNGLGSKAIASQLAKQGTQVSYKTIQRILNGQRPMEI